MLTLSVLPFSLGLCRLDVSQPVPSWATESKFFSISRTYDELSIVCPENNIPANVKCEKNWRAFKVEGPLDFSLIGILSSLITPLAEAKVSIFAISTYDTDYILVKNENFEKAAATLAKICKISRSSM